MWDQEELVVDRIDHNSKRAQAFILTLMLYALFACLLFIDMNNSLFINLPIIPPYQQPHQHPAPVQWTTPPHKTPQPQTPPAAQPVLQKPIDATPLPLFKPALPQTPYESSIDKMEDGIIAHKDSSQTEHPTHKNEDSPTNLQRTEKIIADIHKKNKRKRSSGNSWIRKSTFNNETVYPSNAQGKEIEEQTEEEVEKEERAQNWDRSFRGYLEKRYGKQTTNLDPSTSQSSNVHDAALSVGHELFVNKLVYAVCDTSNNRPLQIQLQSIPLHIITLWVTITKNRTLSELTFEQKSPYPIINRYIEDLIRATPMPQLPYDWHEETLTLPLRVRIQTHPQIREIRLVPASY